MSNSVEYEIAMNEASRREALEAFAILNKKKYTHAQVMDLLDDKTKSQKLTYESEIQEIANAFNMAPCEIQQELQWASGGFKNAIIERIEKLECKLLDIDDNISTLLDGECYTGNIPSSVIAYFREIQNIISK